MKDLLPLFRRYWQFGVAVGLVLILLVLVSTFGGNERLQGSSYSTNPFGYGAWYQMMLDRKVNIERWRKNSVQLAAKYPTGTTLLRVNPGLQDIDITPDIGNWVERGNTLVILGVQGSFHDIEFAKDLPSAQGNVRIETTNRLKSIHELGEQLNFDNHLLADDQGAVVLKTQRGQGHLILVATPNLAANAYQDWPANYNLLANLVSQGNQKVLVDEYIHGYQDPDAEAKGAQGNVITYLQRTPWSIVLLNGLLLWGTIVWQQNRRFGAVTIPQPPKVDNSAAYIEALGGVLRQAKSSEFVVRNIAKNEQLALQQQLGLGNKQLVDQSTLLEAWTRQTQLPTHDLQAVLQLSSGQQPITEAELRQWLRQLQAIRNQLQRLPILHS